MLRRTRELEVPPGKIIEPVDAVPADLVTLYDRQPTEPSNRVVLPEQACASLHDDLLAAELRAFVEDHQRPGPFLYAVLANNLRAACDYATNFEAHRFVAIVAWLDENVPSGAWGSDSAVRTWLAPQIVHALQLHR